MVTKETILKEINDIGVRIQCDCRAEMRCLSDRLIDDIQKQIRCSSFQRHLSPRSQGCETPSGDDLSVVSEPIVSDPVRAQPMTKTLRWDEDLIKTDSDDSATAPKVGRARKQVAEPTDMPPLLPMQVPPPEPPDVETGPKATLSQAKNWKHLTEADNAAGHPKLTTMDSTMIAESCTPFMPAYLTHFASNSPSDPLTGRLSLAAHKARQTKKCNSKTWGVLWQMPAIEILQSSNFDNCIGALILVNAITIGWGTDYMARYQTEKSPVGLVVLEYLFFTCFVAELSLRIYVARTSFFCPGEPENPLGTVLWNWFDFLIVCTQLVEETLNVIDAASNSGGKERRTLRILHVLRLMRILRVMRVLRLIAELRTIVSSIIGAMRSLGWTIVLMLLMVYVVAVFFTQQLNNHFLDADAVHTSDADQVLKKYFGTLDRTILSLYQAVSGGIDWDTLMDPLVMEVNVWMGVAFVVYVAFILLAILNVVTGVFVQTALQSAKQEEDKFMTNQIINLFHLKPDGSTHLSADDVGEVLKISKDWQHIDVDPEEARFLFQLLDINNKGLVAIEEFLSGCLRLKGEAKSIDVLTVMQEMRRFFVRWVRCQRRQEERLDTMQSSMSCLTTHVQDLVTTVKAEFANMESRVSHNRRTMKGVKRQLHSLKQLQQEVKSGLTSVKILEQLFSSSSSTNEVFSVPYDDEV